MKLLTIEDLRNPQRQAGFNYVNLNNSGPKPYRAQVGGSMKSPRLWRGPVRATPEEAAQDYCDYINLGAGAALLAAPKLVSAGHQRPPRRASRTRRPNPRQSDPGGYVYCIGEEFDYDFAVKIGASVDPPASRRVAELQAGNPRKLVVLGFLTVDDRYKRERELHERYIKQNILGEWFRPTRELLSEFGVKKPERKWT